MLYCLDAASGTLLWNYTTVHSIGLSSPAIADGRVYVGCDDNKLYCLDAISGAFQWTFTTGGTIDSSPAIASGHVYVGSEDNRLYCLNATSRNRLWARLFREL